MLEMLLADPSLGRRPRARAVKAMLEYGCVLLAGFGSNVVLSTIPDELVSYLHFLTNRGIMVTGHGNIVMKRL